jgi:TetR/AcrR family transcriptional regulator, transcriptional repressor for nem operon
MPRKRSFDPTETLDSAMRQFWLHGWSESSLDTLVEATGVSRYGLYTVFGSKHGLFVAALDRYRDTAVADRLSALEKPGAAWPAVRGYFHGIYAAAMADSQRHGCLMCNTACESAMHDAMIADRVGAHLSRLERAFLNALNNARADGEIMNEIDPSSAAAFFVGVSQGLFVMARAGAMESIRHTIDLALHAIHNESKGLSNHENAEGNVYDPQRRHG